MAHTHEWLVNMHVFPRDGVEGETYEHDEPYVVYYCADRDCGQRKTELIGDELIAEIRQFNGFPNEQVVSEGGD